MSDTGPRHAARRPARPRPPLVRVDTREPADHSRTSPRMRFDVLQIAAWLLGLVMIVSGAVAIARAGFEDLTLFEPVVEVAGLPTTPLLALLLVLLGTLLLAAATGEVDDRTLRIGGVLVGVVGLVWLIEPGAFEPYLGVDGGNGVAALFAGLILAALSFVPPLSIRRPGVHEPQPPWATR